MNDNFSWARATAAIFTTAILIGGCVASQYIDYLKYKETPIVQKYKNKEGD